MSKWIKRGMTCNDQNIVRTEWLKNLVKGVGKEEKEFVTKGQFSVLKNYIASPDIIDEDYGNIYVQDGARNISDYLNKNKNQKVWTAIGGRTPESDLRVGKKRRERTREPSTEQEIERGT